MTSFKTNFYESCHQAAEQIFAAVGNDIVMAIPIAIGKPIGVVNALYDRAKADPSLKLTIITGLTLARPVLNNKLERRLVGPILDRLLNDYEDPSYELDRIHNAVPSNIKIVEFFLAPGKFLNNAYVQRHYISSAYSSVLRDLKRWNINVVAQQITRRTDQMTGLEGYSLSSNTDLFHAAVDFLKRKNSQRIAVVGEINQHLPFMVNEAEVKAETFTHIVIPTLQRHLFAIPREAISPQDHVIGLYTSTLIKDGSCLQVGIGKLSNAVANALIMRHLHNDDYITLLKELNVFAKFGEIINQIGDTKPFIKGLYASSEMISDEYMQLYQAGILKKAVYDHAELQHLINIGIIDPNNISIDTLDHLIKHQIINNPLP